MGIEKRQLKDYKLFYCLTSGVINHRFKPYVCPGIGDIPEGTLIVGNPIVKAKRDIGRKTLFHELHRVPMTEPYLSVLRFSRWIIVFQHGADAQTDRLDSPAIRVVACHRFAKDLAHA